MPQTAWATAEDVADLTSKSATEAKVLEANTVIELLAGRLYSVWADRVSTRDLEWMKRAVVYQALWMPGQPDYYTRLDFASLTEGGRSITPREEALLLAPMAKAALNQVSWRRTRSLRVRSHFQDRRSGLSSNPTAESNDRHEVWSPMGGG
jgi:hypothetical protein